MQPPSSTAPPASAGVPWLERPVSGLQRVALGFTALTVLGSAYSGVAVLMANQPGPANTLALSLDAWFPLIPETVLIYGFLYAQIFAPLLMATHRRVLLRGGLALTGMIAIGMPFWLLWPVTVPRVPITPEDTLSWGLALIYWTDPPANCFPSMHVAESYLAALIVRRLDRRLGNLLLVSASAIWLSTLLLDQHWLLDGLAGLIMALAADKLAFGLRPLPPEALRPAPRSQLWWMLLVYGAAFVTLSAPWWLGQASWIAGPPAWLQTVPSMTPD